MAEDLTDYLKGLDIKTTYMHSDIDTIERMEIIRDLRLGKYDVLVGINLLREGLDLPEVSLIAILDADKEGFLRSETSLIQTVGRAARNSNGRVVMYADTITKSMKKTIDETERRRSIQDSYNKLHGISPKTIVKKVREVIEATKKVSEKDIKTSSKNKTISREDIEAIIINLENEMYKAAENLEFERAANLRDEVRKLKNEYR